MVFITARKSVLISLSAVHLYDFHIFTAIYSSIHVYIWKQHNDRLLIGLLAQLVEHCTGIVEVMGSWIPWFSEKREINIWTQLLGSRGSFMTGTGAKQVVIYCTGNKSANVWFSKRQGTSRKFFGLPSFWTSNVDNVKEGFLYSLRNVSAWKRHFKKDAK